MFYNAHSRIHFKHSLNIKHYLNRIPAATIICQLFMTWHPARIYFVNLLLNTFQGRRSIHKSVPKWIINCRFLCFRISSTCGTTTKYKVWPAWIGRSRDCWMVLWVSVSSSSWSFCQTKHPFVSWNLLLCKFIVFQKCTLFYWETTSHRLKRYSFLVETVLKFEHVTFPHLCHTKLIPRQAIVSLTCGHTFALY